MEARFARVCLTRSQLSWGVRQHTWFHRRICTSYVHYDMADLRFTWDPAKARANLSKHGISFEEAETVFSDDNAVLVPDPDHSGAEERFLSSA